MTDQTSPIIGLAGGIGSGKSTIAKFFNELGIQSVDADDVAKLIVLPGSHCLELIEQRYGSHIVLNDGTLNRRALREIIFNTPSERSWLESITHPAIRKEVSIQLQAATSTYVLLVHPLLFETKQDAICKYTIVIDVPTDVQLQRVINRDQVDSESAQKIISVQLSNSDRLLKADFILENAGNLNDMNAKVLKLHQKILESL